MAESIDDRDRRRSLEEFRRDTGVTDDHMKQAEQMVEHDYKNPLVVTARAIVSIARDMSYSSDTHGIYYLFDENDEADILATAALLALRQKEN